MIGIYDYTVLFTLFGTISGITGIILASNNNIFCAILALMLCGFFDMFDGTIAKTKKDRTEFAIKYGVQLDSLSDVICFSALPTIIGLMITKPLGLFNSLCILYLIASISRLAYFNVEEEMRTKNEYTKRKTYTGMPVTTTALFIPLLYLFKNISAHYFPIIFLIGLLLIAICQVSKIKFPHLNVKGLILCLLIGILFLSLVLFLA